MLLREVNFDYDVREMSALEVNGAMFTLCKAADISVNKIEEVLEFDDEYIFIKDALKIVDDRNKTYFIDSVFCIEGSDAMYCNVCTFDKDGEIIDDEYQTYRIANI